MIRYIKQTARVIIMTAVLVFGAMLVMNSGVTLQDVKAGTHETYTHHYHKWHPVCDDWAYHIIEYYYD